MKEPLQTIMLCASKEMQNKEHLGPELLSYHTKVNFTVIKGPS